MNVLNDYSFLLPQFMQNQIWSYTESEMALERMSGVSEYGAAYADFLIALPGYFHILLSFFTYYQSQEDKPESTCGSSIDYHACIGSYNQLPFWNSIDGEISIFCNSILGYCLGAEL